MTTYRGAYVTIQDAFPNGELGGQPLSGLYISFGGWDEESGRDSFGVNDDDIFYYCDRGEVELRELMTPQLGADWYVLDYELVGGEL